MPERAECVPDAGEPFLVGVAVRDDEEVDGQRAAEREPEADRSAVVRDHWLVQPGALVVTLSPSARQGDESSVET